MELPLDTKFLVLKSPVQYHLKIKNRLAIRIVFNFNIQLVFRSWESFQRLPLGQDTTLWSYVSKQTKLHKNEIFVKKIEKLVIRT